MTTSEILTLGIALCGGIPGIVQTVQYLTSGPKIKLVFENAYVGKEIRTISMPTGSREETGTIIMLQIALVNRQKDPTTIMSWDLTASSPRHGAVKAQPWVIPENLSVDVGGVRINFGKANLYDIASQTPIEYGRQVRGWARFFIPDPKWSDLLRDPSTVLKVTVTDAGETNFTGEYSPGASSGVVRYFPGAGIDVPQTPFTTR